MEETVVLTPLGWERSRAVLPAEWLRAHRVHLLYRPDFRHNRTFVENVTRDLEERKVQVQTHAIEATREFDSLLVAMSQIVREESAQGNRVYINVSASGKIAAAAAYLTATYQCERVARVFYAQPSAYTAEKPEQGASFRDHGLSKGLAGIQYLPLFAVGRPNEAGERVLAELYRRGPLGYVDLLRTLHSAGLEGFREFEPSSQARGASPRRRSREKWIARLRRQVLNELIGDGYVRTKASHEGRKILFEATDMGRYAALLSGMVDRLYP